MEYLITFDEGNHSFYTVEISGNDILDIVQKFKELHPTFIIVSMQNLGYDF